MSTPRGFIKFIPCGYTTDYYPSRHYCIDPASQSQFSIWQANGTILKDSTGKCFILDSFFDYDPTGVLYPSVTTADFTAQADCVTCDLSFDNTSNGSTILILTPCNAGAGLPTFRISVTNLYPHAFTPYLNKLSIPIYDDTTNIPHCYNITIDNSYGGALDTWSQGNHKINNAFTVDLGQFDTCADCNLQYTQGIGATAYKFTPCREGDGSIFYTADNVTAFEISPGVYKTVLINNVCYTITEVNNTETLQTIPSVTSIHNNCSDCLDSCYTLTDCDAVESPIHSFWSQELQTAFSAGQKVKIQGFGETCWNITEKADCVGVTDLRVINPGEVYDDCTLCGNSTSTMYRLTRCSDNNVTYTLLNLAGVNNKIIQKTSDNSCHLVEEFSPVGGEVIVNHSYSDFVGGSEVSDPLFFETGECIACEAYRNDYVFTNCKDANDKKYSNQVTIGQTYINKVVRLSGISNKCWTVDYHTVVGGETFETLAVTESFNTCASCDSKICYEIENLCNGEIFYALNPSLLSHINQELLFDLNKDGSYNTRGLVKTKIVTEGTTCDNAEIVDFKTLAEANTNAHKFINCGSGEILFSNSTSFNSLTIGQILVIINSDDSDLTDSQLGGSNTSRTKCWQYFGEELNQGCNVPTYKIGGIYTTCVSCNITTSIPDSTSSDDELLTCENPCFPAPINNGCNSFKVLQPCVLDANYEISLKRLGFSEDTEDELVINKDFWDIYTFSGFVNRSKTEFNFSLSHTIDNASPKYQVSNWVISYGSTNLCNFVHNLNDTLTLQDKLVNEINKNSSTHGFRSYIKNVVNFKNSDNVLTTTTATIVVEFISDSNFNGNVLDVKVSSSDTNSNNLMYKVTIIPNTGVLQDFTETFNNYSDEYEINDTEYLFNVGEDGVYIFTIENKSNGDKYEYPLYAHCNLLKCYNKLLQFIFCKCDCTDCTKKYEDILDSISNIWNAYMARIESYYNIETTNIGLTDDQKTLIYSIKDTFYKLNELLEDCNNGCFDEIMNDCGC